MCISVCHCVVCIVYSVTIEVCVCIIVCHCVVCYCVYSV